MSNVIDFNSRKKKIGANAETPPTGFQEMMDAATLLFKDLPQHEMMFDAADALKRRVYKLLLFTSLTTQVNEAIQKVGLDPAGFMVDEMSLDLFIARDLPQITSETRDEIEYFNGPFFEDDSDDKWLYRVATTVFSEEDGIGMASDVMRLDRDAESWEMWYDRKWHKNGPPKSIFEVNAMVAIKEMVEEVTGAPVPEIYDEDDEDEDWDNSIDSMLLTPGVIAALRQAGIETIDQLSEMTEADILAIKGIGKKALEDIKDALDFENLKLKD